MPLDAPLRLLIERPSRHDFTRTLRVVPPEGPPLFWIDRPYHVHREDALLYAEEARVEPLLAVRQKSAPGAGLTVHEIVEPRGHKRFGTLRGKAQSALSIFGGPLEWEILGEDGAPAGALIEEGSRARRLLFGESRFRLELGLRTAALLVAEQGLVKTRFYLTLLPLDDGGPLEPHFAVACAAVAIGATLQRRGGK
jgi:hypothetical protein